MDGDLIGLQGAGPSSVYERRAHYPTDPDIQWAASHGGTRPASRKVQIAALAGAGLWFAGVLTFILS